MPELSPVTGLPELPDNQYWHVAFNEGREFPKLHLSVRERLRWGFWRTVAYNHTTLAYLDPREEQEESERRYYDFLYPRIPVSLDAYPEEVRKLASKVLAQMEENILQDEQERKYQVTKKELSGNYPPKRLES